MSDIDLEGVAHFPIKLWDVVNDGSTDIFRWSADGESFFVDDLKYESDIMEKYPGFAQIPSFANLRRLLREYSFAWQNNDTGEFQFSHPGFKRQSKELLLTIRTKRKSLQAATGHPTNKVRRRSSDAKGSKNASKAWLQPTTNSSVNFRDETLKRFPEKLLAVVNDTNDLLYWGEDGDTIIVDDKKYEEEIMIQYPGFTQINSFANLRRLLREYGFSWSIRENGFFEFSHSHMKRGRPELIKGVKTKRKAAKAGAPHPYLPYFKMESSYHSFPTPKCFSDRYDSIERQCQSSPEVNQAINNIHNGSTGHLTREVHHGGSGDHMLTPQHTCAFPPHRLIPSFQPMGLPHHHMHHGWPYAGGEKLDSHYYYPTWNEGQFPCAAPAFDPNEDVAATHQVSPQVDDSSRSGLQPSTTCSHSSVYASSSKASNLPAAEQLNADSAGALVDHGESSASDTYQAAVAVEPVERLPSCRLAGNSEFTATADEHGQRYCSSGVYQPLDLTNYPSPASDYMSPDGVNATNPPQPGDREQDPLSCDEASQSFPVEDSPPMQSKPVEAQCSPSLDDDKLTTIESNNNNNEVKMSGGKDTAERLLSQLLIRNERHSEMAVPQLQSQLLAENAALLDTAEIKQENDTIAQFSCAVARSNAGL